MSVYDILLNRLLLNHIINYLPIISVQSLVRAVPRTKECMIKSIHALTLERVTKIFGEDVYDLIVDSKFGLTGSALLKVLNDEPWECNDIDFCVDTNNVPTRYFGTQEVIYPINESVYTNLTFLSFVGRCDNYNMLYLNGDPLEYIDGFDMQFCANYLSSNQLVVKYPTSVLKKVVTLDILHYIPRNVDSPLFFMHHFLPSRYLRLEKYLNRGYNINLVNVHVHRCYERTLHRLIELGVTNDIAERIAAYWHMFWLDRINPDTRCVLPGKYPVWKRQDIPTFYKSNL